MRRCMDAWSSARRRAGWSPSESFRRVNAVFGAFFVCLLTFFPALTHGQPATAPAESTPEPPHHKRERLTFDPNTDTWELVQTPVPGTENGDLDIARQYIARQDYRVALPLICAWIAQYGKDAPRYPEALYLQAVCEME